VKELMFCWTNRRAAKAAARILDAEEIPATILDYASRFHTPRFRYGISVPDGHAKRATELLDEAEAAS
jgi:hypothetical protein